MGISSGEVARYSWFSSLKPAPSTTIFKIPTSFRSFPQSCKMWNVQSFIRNYRCFWYYVSVMWSSELNCRTLITFLAFELWTTWAGFWPILSAAFVFVAVCLIVTWVRANKPEELWWHPWHLSPVPLVLGFDQFSQHLEGQLRTLAKLSLLCWERKGWLKSCMDTTISLTITWGCLKPFDGVEWSHTCQLPRYLKCQKSW